MAIDFFGVYRIWCRLNFATPVFQTKRNRLNKRTHSQEFVILRSCLAQPKIMFSSRTTNPFVVFDIVVIAYLILGKVKVLRPRPEHLKVKNNNTTLVEESSDEEVWFDYPSYSRQDKDFEADQSLVDTNVRVGEDLELEFGELEEQSGTPPRRKSTRVRAEPRRFLEGEDQTTQGKAKLSPRMRKRRQSLAMQRDKSTPGMGWILQTRGGGVRSASSPEADML